MEIIPLSAFQDNYIWLLIDQKTKQAACVDPGEAQPVIDYLEKHQLKLAYIMVTHHHNDHIGGVAELIKNYPRVQVLAPDDNRLSFDHQSVHDMDNLSVFDTEFQVLAIPGHTATHLAYYSPEKHLLFSGDTLFSAGCGRVFDGTLSQLFQSIQRLKKLPDETLLYCGHEYTLQNLRFAKYVEPDNQAVTTYIDKLIQTPVACTLPSTLGMERMINPFFRTTEEELIHFARKKSAESLEPETVFGLLRHEKNTFS